MKKIKLVLIFLIIALYPFNAVYGEDQYQVKQTITAPTPVNRSGFGGGVSMNEDLIVIGAPKGPSGDKSTAGVVYVFDSEGEFQYIIESPNPQANAKFGESIVTNDEYIVIAAIHETFDSITEAGRIYVYDLQGNLLQQIQSPEPGPRAHFGASMSIVEDEIIVADEYEPDSMIYGKAYIFDVNGSLKLTIEPPVPMRGSIFGVSPKIYGDYLVISEVRFSQVHIYGKDGTYLRTLESPLFNGQFGICTAVNNDKIIIGESDANLVHIFDFEGNLLHTISPPDGHTGDFGFYVVSEGDLIVISEPTGDVDGLSGAGYVFVYDFDGNLISMINSPDPQENAQFGGGQYPRSLLSISNGRILVGEVDYDLGDLTDAGRAHIIEKGSFLVTLSEFTIEPTEIEVGESVTCSVKCSNEGTFSGQYNLILQINGEVEEEKTVSLDPGASEIVSFLVSGDTEGEYNVDINGETGSFEVKKAQTGIPSFPLIALTLGILLTALFYSNRNKLIT